MKKEIGIVLERIEIIRRQLNLLEYAADSQLDLLLTKSKELDELINEYYRIKQINAENKLQAE